MADDYEKRAADKERRRSTPRKPRRGEAGGAPGAMKLVGPEEKKTSGSSKKIDDEGLSEIAERVDEAYQAEKDNIDAAYDDLTKLAGDQWPDYAKTARKGRPMLTVNLLPQFKRQITGDIRLNKFGVRVAPADGDARKETAEILAGMIRYIQNRSESKAAFAIGGDQMVSCGVGAMRVITEYADETTFNQEIRITQIDDGVSVIWDPDSKLPTREDAMWCLVPVDMSHSKFKRKYPDVPLGDFTSYDKRYSSFWYGSDFVRVGEYWEKRPETKMLALMPDGSISDVTNETTAERAKITAKGGKIREREGYCVYRSLVTLGHYLEEPEEWLGNVIPIIPMIGEEVRVRPQGRAARHPAVRERTANALQFPRLAGRGIKSPLAESAVDRHSKEFRGERGQVGDREHRQLSISRL
jgi:hypothetical protein